MKRILLFTVALWVFTGSLLGNNKSETGLSQDTLKSIYLDEVIISESTKETNNLKTIPSSVSLITPKMISGQNIISVKDLSSLIPNFFIADYGSRLSTPVYIRGIGERSTGQSIGMYVDNMPLLDKSVFDFDFMDVSRIEVLRGPQGTLFGRNAMSGIVNVFTYSPLDVQKTKVSLSAGNHGLLRAKAGTSQLLSKNVGISVNGYYDAHNGYFTYKDSKNKVDELSSAGGRIRLDWRINPQWTLQWMANYDYSDQGAFPYGEYNNGEIADPDHNFPGSYIRETVGSNMNIQFKNEHIVFNSATSFLHFNDVMKMDIDYSNKDVFNIIQKQNQNAFTEELTIKSNNDNNYQWAFGAFAFHNNMKTNVVTTMGKEGVKDNLQSIFDNLPPTVSIKVKDETLPIPGRFKTPSTGAALFHQSTYNNLFTEGLSITAGVRLDYEETRLDYNTNSGMTLNMRVPGPMPAFDLPIDTLLSGEHKMNFTEIMPKVAVKYEINNRNYVYITVSNGYKAGGYNIQTFADIARNALMERTMAYVPKSIPMPSVKPMYVDSVVPYKPEYSWNYETGYKGEVIKDRLFAEVAFYYIDVKDIQITDFVDSGQGRLLRNAGKAKSMGFDLSLSSRITDELSLALNYGFTRATFKDYKTSDRDKDGNIITLDYSGNYIPFAPQNTLSASIVYNKLFKDKWIDRLNLQAHYKAAGRIYWTEANDVYLNFYGLLNLKAGVSKGIFDLNVWANNALNTDYTAFYFETNTLNLAQAGRHITFGVDLSITF